MKKNHRIIRITLSILLAAAMLLSPFVLSSCGSPDYDYRGEVPEELKTENRHKIMNDISEEDRAAYIAKFDEYMQYLNGDYSVIEDLYPDDYWENVGMTPEEAVEKLKASEENNSESSKAVFGEGYKVTYEIESEKNYELMLDSLKSTLRENYDINPKRISKAYIVYINLTISGPKNKSTETYYYFPVNIDGNWYLANASGGFN